MTATTVDTHIDIQNDLNARQEKALHFISKQGSIKNKQYRKLFNVSHKTAHLELAELVQKQKVIIVGSGRSTCYRLPNQGPPSEPLSTNDAVIPRHLLKAFLEQTLTLQKARMPMSSIWTLPKPLTNFNIIATKAY